MKAQKILDSFNYAIDGIIHTVRTQRNMRFHMVAALIVLTVCFLYDLSKPELLAIVISISLVLTTELVNTAIEFTIDLYTSNYHHLAKHAKNAAAGAVLVTALNAVVVGFIIFWKKLDAVNFILINKVRDSSPYTVFMILVIVCITVVIVKAYYGKGTPLKGGMPSGHSALAFSLATAANIPQLPQSSRKIFRQPGPYPDHHPIKSYNIPPICPFFLHIVLVCIYFIILLNFVHHPRELWTNCRQKKRLS